MMRHDANGDWEPSYWDDILHEFGVHAYVGMRYIGIGEAITEMATILDRAYGPEWRNDMSNEFTANVRGRKQVEVALSDVQDALTEQAQNEVESALSVLDDWTVEDSTLSDEYVTVDIDFAGSMTIELDEDDLAQLVREKVEEELGSDFEHLDVEVE